METKTAIIRRTLMALAAVCIVYAPACSLVEDTTSNIAPSEFYTTEATCKAALNGCYMPLYNIFNYTYLIATEACNDLLWVASGTLDAQLAISPAIARFGNTMWTQGYIGVMRCNAAIEGIRSSPLPDNVKNPLIAEGIVMRAYWYYFLTCNFGNVPFYTDDVANEDILEAVAKLGRMPAYDTRKYLVDELMEYIPYLEQVRTYDQEDDDRKGKAGAAMGLILAGKMAMWNKDWDAALTALHQLEEIYGDIRSYDYADNMWRVHHADESIFEVQHTYSVTGLQVTENVYTLCTPYPRTANSSIYDGVEIPELGANSTIYTPMRATRYTTNSLMPRRTNDIRAQYNVAYEYNGITFNNVNNNSVPWMGPKFWCPNVNHLSGSNNQRLFRYGDAILMLAECYYEKGDFDEAIRYMNLTKERAGADLFTTYRNPLTILQALMEERAIELFGEFQRKHDLVRWGIWYDRTFDYTDYSSIRLNIMPCHEYYPIPDSEVVKSGSILDNIEYEKYM